MAEQFDIKILSSETAESRLLAYVAKLPDGKAVPLIEAAQEMGIGYSPALLSAKKAGICFNAFLPGAAGSARALIANPKTVKAWHDAQKKLPR
jgi:hypothetical protein